MRTLVAGFIVIAVAIGGVGPAAATYALPEDPDILVPRAALPDPTVLVVGPGELGTDRLPDIATYVDGVEVQPTVVRRRIGGRWAWAVTIPARAGTVVVRRRDRSGRDVEVERFPIVDRVAAPEMIWAEPWQVSTAAGDDVVDRWSTCRLDDGRAGARYDFHSQLCDMCIAPGEEAFRANGKVVRFEFPTASLFLAQQMFVLRSPTHRRHAWPWLTIVGGVAAAVILAWRRRPRVSV